jgi:mono/diheme cytochrome c family protein
MISIRHGYDGSRILHIARCGAFQLFAVLQFGLMITTCGDRVSANEPTPASHKVDFVAQIEPLLRKRCHRCHGPDAQEGGLRLDRRADALAGGGRGPALVSGDSAKSRIVRFATGVNDERIVMPPEGERLSAAEIGLLRTWIDQGAIWPKSQSGNAAKGADHWAFKRPVRPAVPSIKNTGWSRNAIDQFVLARLEASGLRPAPEAGRATLARRLWLDLLGLLPPVEEVSRFVADPDPSAYEQLVERLLASPHFGERWGRHWLDLARYADSSGYESDTPRSVWRYRDWVIRAINADMPFDQFAIEQLAGDLLPNASADETVASGFQANAMLDPGVRWESVLDQVNTTGTVFLGLTVGCAQCHSHKFDPLTQREYFQLYAFFDHADITPFELASPAQKRARDAALACVEEVKAARAAYETTLKSSLDRWVAALSSQERAQLPAETQAALSSGTSGKSPDEIPHLLAARTARDARYQAMTKEIERRASQVPVLPQTLAMRSEPRETRLFVRGNPERPGEVVQPGVPAFLHSPGRLVRPGRLTRLDLARWLVAAENPLVARVTINRIWQHYFGRGIVETANDFGIQTPAPVHRELLDWLAVEFMSRSSNVKAIHRAIVCSSTYRQSSRQRPELESIDAGNRLLARQRRLRVEAEVIRDIALDAGALLSARLGGPSVFPEQPPGVLDGRAVPATWTTSPGADRYRRGLYTWVWRLTPYPMLRLFDAPDAATACTRRDRSNTPVQALTLLNDPTFVECARGLARRVAMKGGSDEECLDRAFRICLSRPPSPREAELLLRLFAEQARELSANRDAATTIVGGHRTVDADVAHQAAWTLVCRTLLNLDEFMTRE